MKKEKIYSLTYALILGLILVGTSVSAQYASANTTGIAKYLGVAEFTPAKAAVEVETVNKAAIKEISSELKSELDFLKNKIDIVLEDDALVEVSISDRFC